MAKEAGSVSGILGRMRVLADTTDKSTSAVDKNTVSRKKNADALKKQIEAQKKLNNATIFGIRNNRNMKNSNDSLAFSFSVLRSKLLLISFAYGLVIQKINKLVELSGKQQAAEDRLRSAIISTGGAAKFSTKQIKEYASQLQDMTGVSDELTIESSALLATFTKISGEAFPQALEAILDTTVAMNQGKVSMETLKTTTSQVGKALNDPIKGLASLGRVGIQFTKSQKNQIKSFIASNEVAKAQAIIIKELNNQFGGRASIDNYEKSIRDLDSALGDLGERVGGTLMPLMKEFNKNLSSLVKSLDVSDIADYIASLTTLSAAYLFLTKNVKSVTMAMRGFKIVTGSLTFLFLTEFVAQIWSLIGSFDFLNKSSKPVVDEMERLKEALSLKEIPVLKTTIDDHRNSIALLQGEIDDLRKNLKKPIEAAEPKAITGDPDKPFTSSFKPIIPIEDQKQFKEGVTVLDQYDEGIAKLMASGERLVITKDSLNKATLVEISQTGSTIILKQSEIDKLENEIEVMERLIEKKKEDLGVDNSIKKLQEENTKRLADLLSERTKLYVDFFNTVKDSYISFRGNVIDAQLNDDLAVLNSQRERINDQVMLESQRQRELELISNKEIALQEKADKKKKELQRLSLFAETAMAIGEIQINLGKTLAAIQAKWAIIGTNPLLAATATAAAITESSMASTNAAIQPLLVVAGKGIAMAALKEGGDFVTSGPQVIMVGDNPGGRERVQVTPLSSPNIDGPSGGNTVNVVFNNSVMSSDYTEDVIIPQIKEAVRRGADIGLPN